jgi:hypothetical protein
MGLRPVDERLVQAIRILDAQEVPYADIRRALRPLAGRIGTDAPAYTTVRRIAITERSVSDTRTEAIEQIVAKLLRGRLPTPYELEQLREARLYAELVRALAP